MPLMIRRPSLLVTILYGCAGFSASTLAMLAASGHMGGADWNIPPLGCAAGAIAGLLFAKPLIAWARSGRTGLVLLLSCATILMGSIIFGAAGASLPSIRDQFANGYRDAFVTGVISPILYFWWLTIPAAGCAGLLLLRGLRQHAA
jgi:hypothetical protein